jgi:hypothetical protein
MILLLVILLIYLINRMVLNIFLPEISEKVKINISLLSTIICVILYKCKKKIENFESEDDEGETLTIESRDTEDVEELEEDIEENVEEVEEVEEVSELEDIAEVEEVEKEQELQAEEGAPTEQDEEIKKNMKGDLQQLLDDMVNEVDANEMKLELSEPKDGSDTSLMRTEISKENEKVEIAKKIGETQQQVEQTAEPQAVTAVTDEEPRPTHDFNDIQNKYVLTPVSEWMKKPRRDIAIQKGCQCPNFPAFGSNYMTF